MKKTALHAQNEASKKYNPYMLKNFLIRAEDGTAIVDRPRLIATKDDERLFYVILNKDYQWNYSRPLDTTIYFQVIDGKVYGGIYETGIGRRSKRVVAVERGIVHEYDYNPYAYEQADMNEIIAKINL